LWFWSHKVLYGSEIGRNKKDWNHWKWWWLNS
jgi:hypothetical protein